MKIAIYKVDHELFKVGNVIGFNDFNRYLESLEYNKEAVFDDEIVPNYSIAVWVNRKNKNNTDWQNAVNSLVKQYGGSELSMNNIELFDNLGSLYNCILAISKIGSSGNLISYAIPFGHGYAHIERICDSNFGIDFASRIFENNSFKITNVNFYFQSTLRQLTNYKSKTKVHSKSSESYDALNGVPVEQYQPKLGKNVSCGNHVTITKYRLLNYLEEMIPFFDEYETMEQKIELPKVNKIMKSDPLSETLNRHLVSKIKEGEDIPIHLIGYIMMGDTVRLIESEINSIYIRSKKIKSSEIIKTNEEKIDSILNYIKKNKDESELTDYEIEVNDIGEFRSYRLIDIIQTEIEYEDVIYVLNGGYWCTFNHSYLENLNNHLDGIDVRLNTNLSKHEGNLQIRTTNSKITEEDYIESFAKEDNYKIMHKTMIKPIKDGNPHGIGVELCDIVKLSKPLELIAIKKGLSTATSAYSLDQSLLALEALRTPHSFDWKGYDKMYDAKTIGIQWILPRNEAGIADSDKIHTKSVVDGNFKISNLQSILLKNKIMEWDISVSQLDRDTIIYLDSPIKLKF